MFSLTVRSCRSAHFPFPPSPWIPGPYHPCHRANPVTVAFSSSYLQFAGSLQHHALHLSDAGVGCLWSSPRTTSPPASLSRPFQASASCPPGTTYCWWRSLLCGAARRLVDIVLELAIERRAHLVWNGSARSTITPPCSSGCATRGPSSSSSSTALPSECMAYARAGARARARAAYEAPGANGRARRHDAPRAAALCAPGPAGRPRAHLFERQLDAAWDDHHGVLDPNAPRRWYDPSPLTSTPSPTADSSTAAFVQAGSSASERGVGEGKRTPRRWWRTTRRLADRFERGGERRCDALRA